MEAQSGRGRSRRYPDAPSPPVGGASVWAVYDPRVNRTRLALVLVAGALTSCAVVQPDYGEPDPMCGWAPGMEVGWAGRGRPADFGLADRGDPAPVGNIYVEAGPALPRLDEGFSDERQVCVIVGPSRGYAFSVPDGWEPP